MAPCYVAKANVFFQKCPDISLITRIKGRFTPPDQPKHSNRGEKY